MSEELDSGLFNIALSDSESDSSQKAAAPRDRTGQTEDAFQAVRAAYRPKVENGEIWKSLTKLPLGRRPVPKYEAQELLHAVEELYFFRRYEEGAALVQRMFEGEGGGEGLDEEVAAMLRSYETKCHEKLRK